MIDTETLLRLRDYHASGDHYANEEVAQALNELLVARTEIETLRVENAELRAGARADARWDLLP